MKLRLIPLAVVAAFALQAPVHAQVLGNPGAAAGAGSTAETTGKLGVEKNANDAAGTSRTLNTPLGSASSTTNNEGASAGASVGTAKSPKVNAGAGVSRPNRETGAPGGVSAGAGTAKADGTATSGAAAGVDTKPSASVGASANGAEARKAAKERREKRSDSDSVSKATDKVTGG